MQIGVDCQLAVGTRRIFVLDPDEIRRMALQFMLHDEYETHELPSLDQAVRKAEEWPPDLVILGDPLWQNPNSLLEVMERLPGARLLLVGDRDSERGRNVVARGMGLIGGSLRIELVRHMVATALAG